MTSASYEQQLKHLQQMIESKYADSPGNYHMLLSLAESVKAARDHDLNCPRRERK